ncbi:MAG: hypothetical protein HYV45_01855 [Candidatus Moranbacteria bacterium]|nr:hypothetical protein [Candidatus Moranbacteria bacterium]
MERAETWGEARENDHGYAHGEYVGNVGHATPSLAKRPLTTEEIFARAKKELEDSISSLEERLKDKRAYFVVSREKNTASEGRLTAMAKEIQALESQLEKKREEYQRHFSQ